MPPPFLTRMQLVSLAAPLLQHRRSMARFPSSVCPGLVKTLPSVADVAITSHSSQIKRMVMLAFQPLATFGKDCGPDRERSLLFSLPSANLSRRGDPLLSVSCRKRAPSPWLRSRGCLCPGEAAAGGRPLSAVLSRAGLPGTASGWAFSTGRGGSCGTGQGERGLPGLGWARGGEWQSAKGEGAAVAWA